MAVVQRSILYICYQSVAEPLTQTQVIAYLEGLTLGGYRVILLTFEPMHLSVAQEDAWQAYLSRRGVIWHWTRYHKRPRIPATVWDIMNGTLHGLRLCRRYDVSLIHARAHVAGLMALQIRSVSARESFSISAGSWLKNMRMLDC